MPRLFVPAPLPPRVPRTSGRCVVCGNPGRIDEWSVCATCKPEFEATVAQFRRELDRSLPFAQRGR